MGHSAFALIIVGIAISATLTAFNQWLSLTVSLETAMQQALWSARIAKWHGRGSVIPFFFFFFFPAAPLLISVFGSVAFY